MAQAGSVLSLQRPRFDPRPMFVVFMVDAVVGGGAGFFPPCHYHATNTPYSFFHCFDMFHILSCFTNTVESTQFTVSINNALKIDITVWLSLVIMLWYW